MKWFERTQKAPACILGAALLSAACFWAGAAFAGPQSPVNLDDVLKYEYGQSRTALHTVEENIRNADENQRREIERSMIGVLQSPDATFFAKQFACRMLRRIGTAASVPALEPLLRDEKLSSMARFALQGMESSDAGAVLRKALGDLKGDLLTGVVGTLGQRKDELAVEPIAKYLTADDAMLRRAAIKSLGEIGGAAAVKALKGAKLDGEWGVVRDDSLLLCADRFVQDGKPANAVELYQSLSEKGHALPIRTAAYRGLVVTAKDPASVIASLLASDELAFRRAAAGPFFQLAPGVAASKTVMAKFSEYPADAKVITLHALAVRGDRELVGAVENALDDPDESVKRAAIEALASLGDAANVERLVAIGVAGGELGKAAEETLAALHGADNDRALLSGIANARPEAQAVMIRALAARRSDGAISVLVNLAASDDAAVGDEAVKALTELSSASDIPALFELIGHVKSAERIDRLEESIVKLAQSMPDADKRSAVLVKALQSPTPAIRVSALRVMSEFGGSQASQAAVKAFQADEDGMVRAAALDSLAQWPDAAPMDALFTAFSQVQDPALRAKALKGFLRTVDLMSGSVDSVIEKYQAAMDAAKSPDEKAMVIDAASHRGDPAILAFLEKWLDDGQVGSEALKGYQRVVAQLEKTDSNRSDWKVSASNNSGAAGNAIDGNRRTRWDTGAVQTPGQWFQVDLGGEASVQGITLDARGSNGDYPRGYEVYFSFDGKNWGAPVAKGEGSQPLLEIEFQPKGARYIRIVQTGSVDGLFWSIHELNVKVSAPKAQLEHAYEVLKKYQ
ncbi:MAG: hypothetical protein GC154_16420 [bacterium]|nr:hypothetical protein [bacterium]